MVSKAINKAGFSKAVDPAPYWYVVAAVSRLIRIVGAGLISLALAIGLLLCLVFWRDER